MDFLEGIGGADFPIAVSITLHHVDKVRFERVEHEGSGWLRFIAWDASRNHWREVTIFPIDKKAGISIEYGPGVLP